MSRLKFQQYSPIDIDLKLISETHLLTTGSVRFQTDSLLLSYPDSEGAFLGYDRRYLRTIDS